jgi:hypothetical protein
MYSGSGYDQVPTGPPPNEYGQPPNAMATGQRQDVNYMQFTEDFQGDDFYEGDSKIDPETGIVPRHYTDCVCIPIFMVYMVVMLGIVLQGYWTGDPKYLSHGVDGKGRLCGKDAGVEYKPYIFWCRSNPSDNGTYPTDLNLASPKCVSSCPERITDSHTCLMPQRVTNNSGNWTVSGTFSLVKTFTTKYVQNESLTAGYRTEPFAGKYCMPSDPVHKKTLGVSTWAQSRVTMFRLRELILDHTAAQRFKASFGTLGECWAAVAWTSFTAMVLGYLYVRFMKSCGKYILGVCLGLCSLAFSVSFVYFSFTILWWLDGRYHEIEFFGLDLGNQSQAIQQFGAQLSKIEIVRSYQDNLILFDHFVPWQATLYSYIACFVSLSISVGTYSGFYRVWYDERHAEIEDLIEAIDECIFESGDKMWYVFVLIPFDAFIKFNILWWCGHSFMYQITECWTDGSYFHFPVRNQNIASESGAVQCTLDFWSPDGKFVFDFWAWFKVAFFLYGSMWLYELTISLQQFIVSHSMILWYYYRDDINEEEHHLTIVWAAIMNAFKFHIGSIIYMAALNPINRFQRIVDKVLIGNIQKKEENQPLQDGGTPFKAGYYGDCPGCYVCIGKCDVDPSQEPGLLAMIGSSCDGHGACCLDSIGCFPCCCIGIRLCYKGACKSPFQVCNVLGHLLHCGLEQKECWENWAAFTCNPHEIKGYAWTNGGKKLNCVTLYNKDVFNDIIIRSNHLERAALRNQTVIDLHPMVKAHMGSLHIVNKCGVVCIASLCALQAWIMCTTWFSDVQGQSLWKPYVQDPIMASVVAWFYSASIAYSFTMILDHGADVLLWTYSWNKKNNKKSCEKFMPEHLKHIVGHQHLDHDSYPLYGTAEPDMYLGTWMSTRAAKKKEARNRAPDIHDLTHGAHPGRSGVGTFMRSVAG